MKKRLILSLAIVPIMLFMGSLSLNARNPVSIYETFPPDCYIRITGTVNNSGSDFQGLIELGGGPDCPHLYHFAGNNRIETGPPDGVPPDGVRPINPGRPKIIISFVGGNSFCNATGLIFSGDVSIQDVLSRLNLNSSSLLTEFKVDVGC